MADAVLSVQNLTIRYGSAVAVDDLCLEVDRGEVFGLLGPNGSGKSSTLAAISGTLKPHSGTVRVCGTQIEEDADRYRRGIGLVPQELAFYEELSALDNLLFFGRLYGLRGVELRRRVDEVLECVRLSEYARRKPNSFSGGMQRRLNLACALLHEPQLLLLDEPTVGLDPQSREAIFAGLRLLREAGCAILYTTHYMDEAEQLCDRIGIMDHGRLVALGTLDELFTVGVRQRHDLSHQLPSPKRSPALKTPRLEKLFLELTGRSLRER